MRDILARANRSVLARHAASNVLVAFDFDGTLAPLSPFRDAVAMRPRTGQLFERVCQLFPCAVLSGRARSDVLSRLAGAKVTHVVGNHGIEPLSDPSPYEQWVNRALAVLAPALSDAEGIEIENKRFSITVHYRRAPSQPRALRHIMRVVGSLREPPRIIGGKLVVNVLPADAPHKGTALAALARRERTDTVIYTGDDDTDEDAFAHPPPGQLLGIRVGRSTTSKAGYFVRDQDQVDELLEALVAARARSLANRA